MKEATQCVSQFCKAQTQIDLAQKHKADEQERLREQVKTYRALLADNLQRSAVTCAEVTLDDHSPPIFVRMKPKGQARTFKKDEVCELIGDAPERIAAHAENSGFDLPRMLCAVFHERVRAKYAPDPSHLTLSVSKSRERGQNEPTRLSGEQSEVARAFLRARHELTDLQRDVRDRQRPARAAQKEVTEEVIKTLKTQAPESMAQKIQVSQPSGDSTFYLRVRERTVVPRMGVRRVAQILEHAASRALEDLGLSRDFMPTTPLPPDFWDRCLANVATAYDEVEAEATVKRRVTLDRAAPRGFRLADA